MTIGISRFLDGSLFSSESYRPAADGEKTDKNMSGWYFRLAIKTFEMYLIEIAEDSLFRRCRGRIFKQSRFFLWIFQN